MLHLLQCLGPFAVVVERIAAGEIWNDIVNVTIEFGLQLLQFLFWKKLPDSDKAVIVEATLERFVIHEFI
jgi:hypothetical protein